MFADVSSAAAAARHVPVMLDRTVELLAPALQAPGAIHVDGTLGMGGHAQAVLDACPEARLIGIDRDPHALALAGERLAPHGDRATLVRATYDELPTVLEQQGIDSVQGILLDLGLSSLQIDDVDRGFAYATDAPLDMRMDPDQELTAADVVNTYSESDLAQLLRRFSDEKFADRIARAVVAARQVEPFTSSARLVETVAEALPAAVRHQGGGHPAKRTFQALRIEVNTELSILDRTVPAALDALAPGGRLVVLSYHSGEDRIVKQAMRRWSQDRAPADLPVVPEELRAAGRLLTRGAERPTADEVEVNPRAASVRLRAVEKDGGVR